MAHESLPEDEHDLGRLGWWPPEVQEVRRLVLGWSNDVFLVRTVSGKYVVKVFRDTQFFPKRPGREARLLCLDNVRRFGPSLIFSSPLGLVTKYVEGYHPVGSALLESTRVAEALLAALRSLHHSVDAACDFSFDPLRDAQGLIEKLSTRQPVPTELRQMVALLNQLESLQVARPLAFSHNDMNAGNIVLNGDNVVLLDWELAGLSPRYYDLAKLCSHYFLDLPASHALFSRYLQATPSSEDLTSFHFYRLVATCWQAAWLMLQSSLGNTAINFDERATLRCRQFHSEVAEAALSHTLPSDWSELIDQTLRLTK